MKTDAEVLLMLRARTNGKTQEQAAARAGISPRTACSYEQQGKLPSELRQPRTHLTRSKPFADQWEWMPAN